MARHLQKKKSKERTKKLKYIDNKLKEIKECIERIKKIKKFKNEKTTFKQTIISKDEMDKFGKEELKKEKKNLKTAGLIG